MVISDLAEIRRRTESNEAENLDFRRHIAAHHLSIEPFHILANDIAARTDCTACANCCRHTIVDVSPAEIRVIAAFLGIADEQVIQMYTDRASRFAVEQGASQHGQRLCLSGWQPVHDLRSSPACVPQFSPHSLAFHDSRRQVVLALPPRGHLSHRVQRARILQKARGLSGRGVLSLVKQGSPSEQPVRDRIAASLSASPRFLRRVLHREQVCLALSQSMLSRDGPA